MPIYAIIKSTSKYAGQDEGIPFAISLSEEPRMIKDGYFIEGGPGGNYRISDLDFFEKINDEYIKIDYIQTKSN